MSIELKSKLCGALLKKRRIIICLAVHDGKPSVWDVLLPGDWIFVFIRVHPCSSVFIRVHPCSSVFIR
ncbi:hypothetical protein, partial [Symmachiella dynata]|uniref:hypothetical protein n=1 Tax=Symmachiella dynata TaxID=2527995 RepID=UPI0030ED7AD9